MEHRAACPCPTGSTASASTPALAKLLGFSRTFAAEVAEAGGVALDGASARQVRPAARRGLARGRVEPPKEPLEVVADRGARPRDRPRRRRHRRGRQAGRASPRTRRSAGTGPTVLGALAGAGLPHRDLGRRRAAGHRAPPRRRHERAHGRREVASAPTPSSSARSTTARSRRSTTRSCRATPTRSPARSTRPIGRHPRSDWKFAVTADGKHAVTHYETLEAFPQRVAARDPPRDRPHAPDPRAHGRAAASVRRRRACTAPTRRSSARLGLTRQWLHAVQLSFTHPGTGEWTTFESEYPADLAHALEVLRGD